MNREDAHDAKEEKEKNTVLPSRSSANAPLRVTRLRGLIIPMQLDLV
jgi:hypothetical protein